MAMERYDSPTTSFVSICSITDLAMEFIPAIKWLGSKYLENANLTEKISNIHGFKAENLSDVKLLTRVEDVDEDDDIEDW